MPITAEIGLVRFLERTGYDVSYTTNIDIDRVPAELKRHRLVISSGHDQYWTKGIRDAFEAARDGGTNLAFIGADIGDWQIRYEDDRRTIVEYRNAAVDPEPDPALKTVRFRNLVPSRPECTLRGVSVEGQDGPKYPRRSYLVNGSALKDRWFRGTGFTAKSRLRDSVGYEWDAIQPACAFRSSLSFSGIRDVTGQERTREPRRCDMSLPRALGSLAPVHFDSSGDWTTPTGVKAYVRTLGFSAS